MLKHHRGYGKEEMMKRFPDMDESKEEYKFETPKFQVEEVVQESPKEAREPCVRATGYSRSMAQCALQNYSAQHSARYGLGSWVCNPMS